MNETFRALAAANPVPEEPCLSAKHEKAFKRLVTGLNDLLTDIRKTEPDAQFYLEDAGNFYILSGPSHDDNENMRQDRKMALEYLAHSSGGAW